MHSSILFIQLQVSLTIILAGMRVVRVYLLSKPKRIFLLSCRCAFYYFSLCLKPLILLHDNLLVECMEHACKHRISPFLNNNLSPGKLLQNHFRITLYDLNKHEIHDLQRYTTLFFISYSFSGFCFQIKEFPEIIGGKVGKIHSIYSNLIFI